MAAAANAHPDWEPLPWDTACFGFPTARLCAGLDPEGLRKSVASLRAAGMELAYWTTLPEDKAGCAAASALGGIRVDERRMAMAELAYQSGWLSHSTAVAGTCTKAAANPPVARWHIRQWHR